MKILIAPNAFKNSLSAIGVAEAIKEGLEQSNLDCVMQCFPVADGGDGSGELIVRHFNGVKVSVTVHDPLGKKITSSFGLIDNGKTAVIEMADASGLRLLKTHELNPLRADSFGTGELIRHALNKGASKIILCIGGSATVDGATGILRALGLRFLDNDGIELTDLPETLISLDRIDFSKLEARIQGCKLIVLCDVNNKLLGNNGAPAVFGPQKGAKPADVIKLEASLGRMCEVVFRQTHINMATLEGGGAAGGVAAGLAALLNADLVKGIDYFLEITDFEKALEETDLVITGEGSLDIQTLHGKGPFGVAIRAKKHGLPVIGIAGIIPEGDQDSLKKYFDVLLPINYGPTDLSTAIKNTRGNLLRTGNTIGHFLAVKNNTFADD